MTVGLIAPMVATATGDVAFLALLAGPGVCGEDIIVLPSRLLARAMGADEEAIEFGERTNRALYAAIRAGGVPAHRRLDRQAVPVDQSPRLSPDKTMEHDNLITVPSDLPVDTICGRLPDVAQAHAFSVLGCHDLKQKLISKGQDFRREVRVFDVCNPVQANRVLSEAIEVSTALPCRIAVYEQEGKAVLATIKPTQFLAMFDVPGAAAVAQEVEEVLTAIMREAAAG